MLIKDNRQSIFDLLNHYGTRGRRLIVYASTTSNDNIDRFGIPSLDLRLHLRADNCSSDAQTSEELFRNAFPHAVRVCSIE